MDHCFDFDDLPCQRGIDGDSGCSSCLVYITGCHSVEEFEEKYGLSGVVNESSADALFGDRDNLW